MGTMFYKYFKQLNVFECCSPWNAVWEQCIISIAADKQNALFSRDV